MFESNGQNLRITTSFGQAVTTSSLALVDDTWHFVGVKVDATIGTQLQHLRFYLDGGAETPGGGNTTQINTDPDRDINLASADENSGSKWSKLAYGLVYNRALSDAEIAHNRMALAAILAGRAIMLP